jgi:CubicO group peptidase (beta-lactamase class C family)
MRLSSRSYGKTGGAGTYMWIDPARHAFGILLTNHGLPLPFDEPGWDALLDATAPGEFFDGLVEAIAP